MTFYNSLFFKCLSTYKFLSAYKFMHLADISWAHIQLFPPRPEKETDKGFLVLNRNENETNMREFTMRSIDPHLLCSENISLITDDLVLTQSQMVPTEDVLHSGLCFWVAKALILFPRCLFLVHLPREPTLLVHYTPCSSSPSPTLPQAGLCKTPVYPHTNTG